MRQLKDTESVTIYQFQIEYPAQDEFPPIQDFDFKNDET